MKVKIDPLEIYNWLKSSYPSLFKAISNEYCGFEGISLDVLNSYVEDLGVIEK